MAHTAADVLEVHHHDDRVEEFLQVSYTPWSAKGRRGVTVFLSDGSERRFDDIANTVARRRHS